MNTTGPTDIGIPDTLRQLLAEVVMQWAYTESYLTHLLAVLLGAHYGAVQYLTEHTSAASTMRAINDLAPTFLREEDAKTIRQVLDRADAARAERNVYAHGLWAPVAGENAARIQVLRPSGAEMIREILTTPTDLSGLLEDIHEINTDLSRIIIALKAANLRTPA